MSTDPLASSSPSKLSPVPKPHAFLPNFIVALVLLAVLTFSLFLLLHPTPEFFRNQPLESKLFLLCRFYLFVLCCVVPFFVDKLKYDRIEIRSTPVPTWNRLLDLGKRFFSVFRRSSANVEKHRQCVVARSLLLGIMILLLVLEFVSWKVQVSEETCTALGCRGRRTYQSLTCVILFCFVVVVVGVWKKSKSKLESKRNAETFTHSGSGGEEKGEEEEEEEGEEEEEENEIDHVEPHADVDWIDVVVYAVFGFCVAFWGVFLVIETMRWQELRFRVLMLDEPSATTAQRDSFSTVVDSVCLTSGHGVVGSVVQFLLLGISWESYRILCTANWLLFGSLLLIAFLAVGSRWSKILRNLFVGVLSYFMLLFWFRILTVYLFWIWLKQMRTAIKAIREFRPKFVESFLEMNRLRDTEMSYAEMKKSMVRMHWLPVVVAHRIVSFAFDVLHYHVHADNDYRRQIFLRHLPYLVIFTLLLTLIFIVNHYSSHAVQYSLRVVFHRLNYEGKGDWTKYDRWKFAYPSKFCDLSLVTCWGVGLKIEYLNWVISQVFPAVMFIYAYENWLCPLIKGVSNIDRLFPWIFRSGS